MSASSRTLPRTSGPLSTPPQPGERLGTDLGLLVLRLVVGLTIAAHGAQKLFGWFGGGGLDGTEQFFTMLGYPNGRAMAVVAGLSETLGGLGLVLGLLTPLAAAAVFGTMLNAFWTVDRHGGFIGGYELVLLIAGGAVALALAGPGRLAADRFVPGLRTPRPVHGAAALALGLVVGVLTLVIRN